MESFLTQVWQELVARTEGPMKLRLIVQPLIACGLAIRAGLRDARDGNPPFFWALAFGTVPRRDLLRQGWKDIGTIFVVAAILDAVYQFIVLRTVHVVEAIAVAILVALVPYLLVRAPVTRLTNWMRKES